MNVKKTKYLIGGFFIALGVGIVVATSLPKSFQYYVTVDELLSNATKFENKDLKVAGKVVQGSFQSSVDLSHQFRVINNGKVVNVTYKGALPDTFKEGAEVVVTGRLVGENQIVAKDVLAKCASKYQDKMTPGYDVRKGS